MPPTKGMLVRVEKSGSGKNKVGGPMGEIEPGWSVEKIKLMGADAVKLLAPLEPGEPVSAEHQFALIRHVYEQCKKYDVLMLLEPVAFPYNAEKKTDKDNLSLFSSGKTIRSYKDGTLSVIVTDSNLTGQNVDLAVDTNPKKEPDFKKMFGDDDEKPAPKP